MHVDERSALSALDLMGGLVTAVLCAILLGFPFFVAPAFEKIFQEMGGALPALTLLMLGPGPAIGFSLLAGALLAWSAQKSASLGARRLRIVGAFAVALLGMMANLIGLYLPIFQLANNVK